MPVSKKSSRTPKDVRQAFAAHASLLFHAVFPSAIFVQSTLKALATLVKGKRREADAEVASRKNLQGTPHV